MCLIFTFMLIIASTVLTLVMMETSRDNEAATSGYHFDYQTRELVIYPSNASFHTLAPADLELFKVTNNCSSIQILAIDNFTLESM